MAKLADVPVHHAVVRILAVQVYDMRQTDLLDCLEHLGCRDEAGRPFSYKTLAPVLKALAAQKAILTTDDGLSCPEGLGIEIIKELAVQGQYTRIAGQVLKAVPLVKPQLEAYIEFRTIKEFARAVFMALLSDSALADPDLVRRSGQAMDKKKPGKTTVLFKVFASSFRPDFIEGISLPRRWKLLGWILEDNRKQLIPDQRVIEYAQRLASEHPGLDRELILADHYLLTGKLDLIEDKPCSEAEPSPRFFVQQGKKALLKRHISQSVSLFRQGLDRLEQETPGRHCFSNPEDNLFFLLAILGNGHEPDTGPEKNYLDQISQWAATESGAAGELFKGLTGLIFHQPRSVVPSEFQGTSPFTPDNGYPAAFFLIMLKTWSQEPGLGKYQKDLETIREKCIDFGAEWLLAEVYSLMARLNFNFDVNNAIAGQLHRDMGTVSLLDLFVPAAQWKKPLALLAGMGRGGAENLEQACDHPQGQRLVWQLIVDDRAQGCRLIPCIQLKTPKGWSKPKFVDIRELYRNYLTLDFLSPQDHHVCAAIEPKPGLAYGDFPVFEFNLEKALPALAGHSLIFSKQNFVQPVTLAIEEPRLRLAWKNQHIHIFMDPMPGHPVPGLCLIKESPFRYKIARFNMDQINMARLLKDRGLVIPEKEEKRIEQAISSVSSFMAVHSDLKVASIQEFTDRAADAAIHVLLTPFKKGLVVETRVNPVKDNITFFLPGQGSRYLFRETGHTKIRTIRNLEQETDNLKNIIRSCPTLETCREYQGEWHTDDPEQILELLMELKGCKEPMVLKWPKDPRWLIRSEKSLSDLSLSIQKDRQWFKARGSVQIDTDTRIELFRFMEMLESSYGRFIPLDDGTFLAITKSLKRRIEELKAFSTPHGKDLLFSPLAAPAIEELTDQAGHLDTDLAWKTHCRNLKQDVHTAIPDTLTAVLRDYQVTGFHWLCRLAHWQVGGCLADDMGLGKTVQSLAAILVNAHQGPSLVVAPLSVLNNWEKEAKAFTSKLSPLIFGGRNRQEFLDHLKPFDLVICSYGLLQTESKKLAGIAWQTIVLDEAQAIKNRKTKRSKAAMALNGKFRLITTGTPVENHLEELWTLFNFLNPGLLGTFKRFKTAFALPIEGNKDPEAARRLRKLIRPFLLRRKKDDVLKELPEKTEVTLQIEMSREESLLYEAQRLKSLQNIAQSDDSPHQKHFRILAELTRLRRLCCNPSLVLPDTHVESSKLKVFMDTVTEIKENHHRALVFSQFVGHLDILRNALSKQGFSFQYLDGATPQKDRILRIQKFQEGQGDLFLISLKAGGTGLNLTAADYVIHMDPWWNPAVEDQASDRAHRIGQTRPVTVYRLVVKDSIEERIMDLHSEKRDLAQSLLARSEFAGKLSTAELLALMQETKP